LKVPPSEPPILGGESFAEGVFLSVRQVFSQARESGAPTVGAVIIEDPRGRWRDLLLGFPLEARIKSVLVYQSPSALDLAGRLSVGGALPFPPSTLRAVDASCAACREGRIAVRDPAVFEEMRRLGCIELRLQPEALWKRVVGLRGMLSLLQELAEALGKTPGLDALTMLLPRGLRRHEIRAAWMDLKTRPSWALEEMLEIDGEPKFSGTPTLKGRLAFLPEGEFAGLWTLDEELAGWEFVEIQASIEDGLIPSDGGSAEFLRLPAWLSLDLELPGTPGRELLEFWKQDEAGPQPWISNLRADGLAVVLALGRRVLVDGPVVPE